MDFRNFFFDFGIIRTVGSASISVDLAEKSDIFFIPGTNYRWREFITDFEVTENLGQIQTVEVRMAFPLDVGFYVLDVGLLSIAGVGIYRFGYIGDQPVGFDSVDPLRNDWFSFMIFQPRFEVNENIVRIEFKGVSVLYFTSEASEVGMRTIQLTEGVFTVGQFIGWQATNLLGIRDRSKIKFQAGLDILNKDAYAASRHFRSHHNDTAKIVYYDAPKYMSNIEFFRMILADFNLDFVDIGNGNILIFSFESARFINQKEKPKVRFKWMGQVNVNAPLREIPITSVKVPHHWLFLPRGSGSLIQIERNKETGEFKQLPPKKAITANLEELREKGLHIELKVRGSSIGKFVISPGFDDQIVNEYADADRMNRVNQKYYRDVSVGNLDLEIETVGLPDLHAGDIVEVVGFPSSSTVRSFVRGKKILVTRFSPSERSRFVNMITLGGKYRILQISHVLSDNGYTNIIHLLRTLPFVPSGESPTERKITDTTISFAEIVARGGESLLKKKKEHVVIKPPPSYKFPLLVR